MEKINCEICKGKKYQILLTAGDRLQNTKGKFDLVKCRACNQIYINPRPSYSEINKYYEKDYKPFASNKNKLVKFYLSYIFRRELKRYKKLIPGKAKVLEIGCSTGDFLAFIRDTSYFRVEGIEISQYAAEKAKKEHKLRVQVANINDCSLPRNTYDLVIMKYVLEHLHHPSAALKKISNSLKEGGVLVLWVPNYNGIVNHLFGRYWYGLDIPRHLFNFTPETIEKILKLNNFEIKKVEHDLAPNDFISSLRYLLEEKTKRSFKWLNFSNSLVLLIFYPFSLACALLRRSGRIQVTALKK